MVSTVYEEKIIVNKVYVILSFIIEVVALCYTLIIKLSNNTNIIIISVVFLLVQL